QAGLLSGGIAQALITTAYGLFFGIIALIAFNFFDARVDKFVVGIDTNAHLLLKNFAGMGIRNSSKLREISDGA
ncbi:MAG: MotA/TolQ/ExbB proton channel family protein, partial [bacterium]